MHPEVLQPTRRPSGTDLVTTLPLRAYIIQGSADEPANLNRKVPGHGAAPADAERRCWMAALNPVSRKFLRTLQKKGAEARGWDGWC